MTQNWNNIINHSRAVSYKISIHNLGLGVGSTEGTGGKRSMITLETKHLIYNVAGPPAKLPPRSCHEEKGSGKKCRLTRGTKDNLMGL